MNPRTRSRAEAPTQKPQNPQKPGAARSHLRRRPTRPAAAKTRETAAQISTAAGPQHGPRPAAHFCGDSRDFCGNHPHTPAPQIRPLAPTFLRILRFLRRGPTP